MGLNSGDRRPYSLVVRQRPWKVQKSRQCESTPQLSVQHATAVGIGTTYKYSLRKTAEYEGCPRSKVFLKEPVHNEHRRRNAKETTTQEDSLVWLLPMGFPLLSWIITRSEARSSRCRKACLVPIRSSPVRLPKNKSSEVPKKLNSVHNERGNLPAQIPVTIETRIRL